MKEIFEIVKKIAKICKKDLKNETKSCIMTFWKEYNEFSFFGGFIT